MTRISYEKASTEPHDGNDGMGIGYKNVLMAAATILLLSGVSYAATCPFGSDMQAGACVKNLFLNYANIVLVVVFGMLGVGYMLAKASDSPRAIRFVESEIWQTVGTMVILLAIWSMVAILDRIVAPMFYQSSLIAPAYQLKETSCNGETFNGGWVDAQSHVMCYMDLVLKSNNDAIRSLVRLSSYTGMLSSFSYQLSILSASLYFSPFAVLGSVNTVIGQIIGFTVAAMVALQLQIEIMKLANPLMTIVLPLGVLFRSFTFTRSIGNSMIAVAFGFAVVLPVMYLITEDISMYYYTSASSCGGRPKLDSVLDIMGTGLEISWDGADRITELIGNEIKPGGKFGCLAFLMTMETMIFPFIGYTSALAVMRRIADILGSQIDFSAIVRFI
jgi:hypothetical protein